MSKRRSDNTLFSYFTKVPSTPKSNKLDNGDTPKSEPPQKKDAEQATISKRSLSDGNSSDEEVAHKSNLKKRRRILSHSDSDDETQNEKENVKQKVLKVEKIPPAEKKAPKQIEVSRAEKEAIADDDMNYVHTRLEFLKPENIRDAKKRRPNDPDYDPRTLYVPDNFLSGLSPGVRQWWDLKSRSFDCVLFFKVGKFYELYHMDADIAVKELDCTYMKGDFAHSGFPEISYEKMATKLVERGYKVARVEQTETPDMMTQRCKGQRTVTKFDKVVRREICQITNRGTQVPGVQTVFEGDHKPNYMMAIREEIEEKGRSYGICFIDTAIGEFTLGQFVDDRNSSRFRTLLSHNPPALVIYAKDQLSSETQQIIKTVLHSAIKEITPNDSKIWGSESILRQLEKKYSLDRKEKDYPKVLNLMQAEDESTAKVDYELCIGALGACIWYMQQCLIDHRVLTMASFKLYTPPDVSLSSSAADNNNEIIEHKRHMVLDSITLSNLRLIGGEQSLLNTLDQCCTKFGKRLLHYWVCCPSYSVNEIKSRQQAIAELIDKSDRADEIRSFFSTLPDLEKQLSQIHGFGSRPTNSDHPDSRAILFEEKQYNTRKIQNFIALLRGFESLVDIPDKFADFGSSKLLKRLTALSPDGEFPDLKKILEFFNNAFDHKEALEQGVIAPEKGVDAEYDAIEEKIDELKAEMKEYLNEQKTYFGCDVKYFGNDKKRFQLEIPENRCKKATSEYFLEGQKKGSQPVKRYNTARTKEFLKQMMQLEDERNKVLQDIARRIFKQFSAHYQVWKKCIDCIAQLDVLLSLAAYTKTQHVVCVPEISESSGAPFIEIEEGCHPCMAASDDFIPNDITIGEGTGSLFLLTGPNMGGKSTLMRQVGLISVLAHMGAHVPAKNCRMSLMDRIFTRLGAQDDILAGHSTFLVELNETSSIIKDATKRSLVLLDELGRGTATYDGTAIAVAVAKFLADLGSRSIFSTHYHNLIHYFQDDKIVALGHMSCMVENEDDEDPTQESVTFLYKLAPGACPKSYGFNAAKLAGMPNEITKRAANISKTFMEHSMKKKLFAKILCKTSVPMIRQLIATQN